jgi:hypothetical protein
LSSQIFGTVTRPSCADKVYAVRSIAVDIVHFVMSSPSITGSDILSGGTPRLVIFFYWVAKWSPRQIGRE